MSALEKLREIAASRPALGAVRLELEGPVARLTIDHPTARNALSAGMMAQLADAVDALSAWPGAAVVLQAAPCGVFCAGGHLGDVRAALVHEGVGRLMALAMGEVLDRLLALPVVSVAAVNGLALGGGAELITACDHRVLARDARVQFVHVRLGVAPGWGGAGRLALHVGHRAALRLLTTAAPIDAEAALAMGLADAVVDDAIAGADAFLAPVLAHPVEAVRAVKAQLAAARPALPREAEADAFAAVWGGPAHRRALGL